MTDYFSQLEDQLGQVTESGIHNRRRLGGRAPRPGMGLLAAATSMIVVVAAVAVALGTGGAVRSPPPASSPPRVHSGAAGSSSAALRAGGASQTKGGSSYCMSSITHARTACSPRTGSVPNGEFPGIRTRPGAPVSLVAQLPLHAPSGAKRPAAVSQVLEQGGGFEITIVAAGLAANTKRDAYAVWLSNGRREYRFLGFVNPPVKTNGRLKTAGALPVNAFRYDKLLITLETQAEPAAPGAVALEGPFHR